MTYTMAWPVVTDRSYSAMIAPNDEHARRIANMLRAMRLDIPTDISVVSFDNTFEAMFTGISSVDFDRASLGFQAFHAIWGDLPLPANRELVARPVVVNRGSVADVKGRG
jgi:DNA-binding LacI/PurR family transcriptional regulator